MVEWVIKPVCYGALFMMGMLLIVEIMHAVFGYKDEPQHGDRYDN